MREPVAGLPSSLREPLLESMQGSPLRVVAEHHGYSESTAHRRIAEAATNSGPASRRGPKKAPGFLSSRGPMPCWNVRSACSKIPPCPLLPPWTERGETSSELSMRQGSQPDRLLRHSSSQSWTSGVA